MAYVTADTSLPRSLDVQISLSRAQTETRTPLNVACLAAENLGFLPDANRVRFYSSLAAVLADFDSTSEAYQAASAFFAQDPRATTMAIGEVFLDPIPGVLVAAALSAADIASLAAIDDGNLQITINGTAYDIDGIDFTGATSQTNIAAAIQTALTTAVAPATCAVRTFPGGVELVTITTTATGDLATVAYPITTGTGTYIGTLAKFDAAEGGKALSGYTPTDIAGELQNVQNAANASDQYLYGWDLGASLRDAAIQATAAEWVLATVGIMTLITNDVTAYDPSYTTDIGSVVAATGNRRAVCFYHDNAQRYPGMSILAYMLHVDYRLQDSTVTAKFKQLPGIETVTLSETQWAALQAKGYNTYTAIGNNSRTYRDGTTEESGWYMDTVINLDNFREDLSVNVYNVFLRNKKVPYTRRGQMLLVDACRDTGYQYTFNGTFADRETLDSTKKGGTTLVPAVQVLPTPIANMSAADRADRIAPPIEMIVQEAGAMHSIAISVEVVS